jgi:hypothetical protein
MAYGKGAVIFEFNTKKQIMRTFLVSLLFPGSLILAFVALAVFCPFG